MGRPDPNIKPAILAQLRQQFPNMCRHWFEDIEPIDISGGTLRLLVREPVQLKYLQRCCVDQFTEAAQAVTGRLLAVRFIGEAELNAEGRIGEDGEANAGAPVHTGGTFITPEDDMLLSPDYSFSNFIVGPGNQLAHAAALAVARKPGKAYNPFFVHSGVGLGKTHLLQSICQTAMRNNQHLRIYYISCNAFMNQFVDAVQNGQMSEFRHRYRHVDMLLIDDIHDLATRDQTQEEFFHTFNTLYQTGRQIVLSSDALPAEIPNLEERLTSRFNCGLVARIEKPTFETRLNILRNKAAIRNLELPDQVASYIAAKIDTNIRDLEASIITLQHLSTFSNTPISLELAQQAVGEQFGANEGPQSPTVQMILDTITNYYDLKLADLLSHRRHKSIALPRQIGMWLTRKHTRYSLEEIGTYFGGRDHTTVMHAIRAVDSKRQAEPKIDQDVTRIEDRLRQKSGESSSVA
jgi:chromosomal replication initiator protein